MIHLSLENEARAAGIAGIDGTRRRMTVEEMLALGSEIATLPVRDRRSPGQITDELNDR